MASSASASSSSPQRAGPLASMPALAFLLVASVTVAGVRAEDVVVTEATSTAAPEVYIRGDMIPLTSAAPEPNNQLFNVVMETQDADQKTTAPSPTKQTAAGSRGQDVPAAAEDAADAGQVTVDVSADQPQIQEQKTPPPALPPRGDGPENVPEGEVVCVSKEAVQDKNAVNLKLIQSSNCKNTKQKIQSVLQELCAEDCKLEIFQEDNTDQILVSGQYVEDDIDGMVNKFNNDNVKDKAGVREAVPHWRKNSKLVLVSLLLTGLLLAALLVAGYYFRTHRRNSKGVRLAESYQVDEENQANTLVSVAPLPQEPVNKPPAAANGESPPPENGTNPAPTTNGHSATGQTPVADTEM
ncbi:hematopoietic progenitor cell antigen CD34 isoform X2 [Syngnathoides biaculeatus]|uniref:hematopoietic progenitor cell antigen CD34 isoform X2 n=1 Tax=Syngnathoides biaculeatus TaxID=300417 RepID=UPI002ADDB04E|nr:hematopoietic progenitor cell antigen CD34 isoform X2 [Syngnathoides biaculeatus]